MAYYNSSREMIRENQRIYIDTCALMNTFEIERFLKNNKWLFVSNDKKIIVQKVVWLELIKHLSESNEYKQKKASEAINLIAKYSKVFEIEDVKDCNISDVKCAFADREILQTILSEKLKGKQLLITNDKGLSKDVDAFNSQESYKGHCIVVCQINDLGQLDKYDSLLNKVDVLEENKREKDNIEKIEEKNITEHSEDFEKEILVKNDIRKYILSLIGAFGAGVLVDRYGVRLVKKVSSMIH